MNKPCPVCGKSDYTVVYEISEFKLQSCNECKLIIKTFGRAVDRQKSQALQDLVYTDLKRVDDLKRRKRLAHKRLMLLTNFIQKGNLLEIGCATGEFQEAAVIYGFDTYGIDSSEKYARYAQEKGLQVKHCRLEDVDFKVKQFDVIVMFHLFEHIENPNTFLQQVRNYLSDQGLLMIIVPNLQALTDKLFGFKYPGFHQKDHLFFYKKSTLSRILINNGFKVIKVQSQEDPHHFFLSFSEYIDNFRKKNTSSQIASSPNKSNTKKNVMRKIRIYIRYGLVTILYPILMVYVFMVKHLNMGEELIIFARKQKSNGNDRYRSAR